MTTGLGVGPSAPSPPEPRGFGRGLRAVGARLVALPFLIIGIGLGTVGFVDGLYEPFTKAKDGVIVVSECQHNDRGHAREACEGAFYSADGAVEDSYADLETSDVYAKGDRIPAVQVGEYDYETSVVAASAGNLGFLFGGWLLLLTGLFCLIVGRWPGFQGLQAAERVHEFFSRATLWGYGVGLSGVLLAVLMDGVVG